MKKIVKKERLQQYITMYNINELFSEDYTNSMELLFFEKHSYLCKEGEKMEYVLFVVQGKQKVYITLENGKSLLLCFYNPFKIIGDLELVTNQGTSNNVQAVEDTYCIGIPFAIAIKKLLKDIRFLQIVSNSLGRKLTRCSKNSSINLLYPLENRLASYIVASGEKTINKEEISYLLEGNLTELAELLGTSYRHLHRTLQRFCEKEILSKRKNGFIVSNESALQQFVVDLYE